ncbi:MAG: low molecular weight protein-tyrosine-phosphatase [Pseudobdellovibrionaceae bacterium]
MKKTILFVCSGNICRSPAAEGVFRHFSQELGLDQSYDFFSCGMHGYHEGSAPDRRMLMEARTRGYDFGALRASKITRANLEEATQIYAMDQGHMAQLRRMASPAQMSRIQLFSTLLPRIDPFMKAYPTDIPDPYYGDQQNFTYVLDLIERGAKGFFARSREAYPDLRQAGVNRA